MKTARFFSVILLTAAMATSQLALAQPQPIAEQSMAPAAATVQSVVTPSKPGGPLAQPQAQQETAPQPDTGNGTVMPNGPMQVRPGVTLGGVPHQITPKMMEGLYHMVWSQIAQTFYKPEQLSAWATWEHKYDGKLTTLEEMDKAIKEMVSSLNDRWTEYTSPSEIQKARQAAAAGVEHLGMHLLRQSNGSYIIDAISYGSPAYNSNTLREGDIVRIIGTETLQGKTQDQVDTLLYGKTGDAVKVTYEVGGKPQEVELKWAPEPEEAVLVKPLPGNIGYIRLPTFVDDEAVEAFMQGLAALMENFNYDMRGLVFDLRNNSGGKFENALNVSSLFIKEGVVTKSKTRSGRQVSITDHTVVDFPTFQQQAMPAEMLAVFKALQNVPMVVLVNGSSASASEVTTGALRDNVRAYVIGTKTFGKGVGYSMGRLPNGGGLTVTSLSYLTPKGFDLGGKGIDPDKVVENPRGQDVDAQLTAAVEYLNAQNALRMKQLQDARTQAIQPHAKLGIPEVFTTVNGTSVSVGLGVVCFGIILVLFLAARRSRRNAIKGGAKPHDDGDGDCGCPHS